ncbi:chemotaxis response regulator protein-glutamate methylesterase of group 2 operon [Methylobacterium phyllosphaerae]|uniref:Protein-glutamate methylesterase/protein-glutamine glutaminase n=1 Tax=Methylobacterium phyllosphaerae TaxID=418223 RepID=A0AAE8HWD5_9HYPH|nr:MULTISPECIES: chemotaxis-specific protein-glutamate methyltransferase CheB [Methylobacterium]APT32845.1 chemotaxis response regulator protein-glutamate methylesterase of group 2 operon [Methylobacterium phyllosphaerae]KOX45171.1 chemotaxis protein CheY [Streptomyces purpurogeneiscleroticus]MDE4911367.1 chemotaxis-specific protein-glutamate methyltransferase CheB [Methylobacterium sp. 092160098-2]SFH49056.1 two-component system, chemotaxis family, response regulator CheB [Methylobacterium phy
MALSPAVAPLRTPTTPSTTASATTIRVLVADDSAVVRGLVARWIGEAGFELVGTASNGRIALELMAKHDPDVVLLDIEMPELDGTTALPRMLAMSPSVQVVMMSTLTTRNADISLKCLALGAVDYIAKPESSRGVTTSDTFRVELIERVRVFGSARARSRRPAFGHVPATPHAPAGPAVGHHAPAVVAHPAPAAARPATPFTLRPKVRNRTQPRALLIGSSTGGPRAVGEMLEGIGSAALRRLPVLIVQHMPPIFTAVFAEHLATRTGLPAAEGKADERVEPGRIYVAPGGRHMGLAAAASGPIIKLTDGPPVNFCRPAVDVLFKDAAVVFGAATATVILTGMGSDGTNGARALTEAGGPVLAQDEATSTVWGMPGSVARAGLAEAVLPLPELATALRAMITGQPA